MRVSRRAAAVLATLIALAMAGCDAGSGGDDSVSARIQADGKIVAAGSASSDFAVVRYLPDGRLDPTFGERGKVLADFGGNDVAVGVAIHGNDDPRDGADRLPGEATSPFSAFSPDGRLDRGFGADGKVVTTEQIEKGIHSFALQRDGKIVALGELESGTLRGLHERRGALLELDYECWRHTLAVDLDGVSLCAQRAVRGMVDQGRGGRIVNVTSVHEHVPLRGASAYCAAKGGFGLLTRVMRWSWPSAGSRSTQSCPARSRCR